jgi:hypothetical protein
MWNCGFVATTFILYTQFVLGVDCVPVTKSKVGLPREMHIFMSSVFGGKLQTDNGILLVSAYETKRGALSIHA